MRLYLFSRLFPKRQRAGAVHDLADILLVYYMGSGLDFGDTLLLKNICLFYIGTHAVGPLFFIEGGQLGQDAFELFQILGFAQLGLLFA